MNLKFNTQERERQSTDQKASNPGDGISGAHSSSEVTGPGSSRMVSWSFV